MLILAAGCFETAPYEGDGRAGACGEGTKGTGAPFGRARLLG
ncbi:hypothetical protein Z947_2294 [Sulfitobacter geojensis]|nr:hypothetical protein Z947_2294 [Sulfitobacter geojensis]